MAKKTRIKKKRVRLAFDEGIIFVHSSFNNTIISLTDRAGNVLAWSSGGKIGNKGSRKSLKPEGYKGEEKWQDIPDQKQRYAASLERTSLVLPSLIAF